jgi:hypothetical protein
LLFLVSSSAAAFGGVAAVAAVAAVGAVAAVASLLLLLLCWQNAFIPAVQTHGLLEAMGGSRVVEDTLEKCCGRRGNVAAHAAWLKAGHLLLQVSECVGVSE